MIRATTWGLENCGCCLKGSFGNSYLQILLQLLLEIGSTVVNQTLEGKSSLNGAPKLLEQINIWFFPLRLQAK